jgi:hypothetical protein
MRKFVFWTGIYNIGLAATLALPWVYFDIFAVNIPDHVVAKLIAGFLGFTAAVLIISSTDLEKFASLVSWEALLRFVAAALLIPYGFFGHMGLMAGVLGLGDLAIGVVYLVGLQRMFTVPYYKLFNPATKFHAI